MAGIGRAIRSVERHESVHQMVCTVDEGRIEWKYLGVHIPDIDQMGNDEIEERFGALRLLLTTKELGRWTVQAVTTEISVLQAVIIARTNHQLTIDDVLPPIDGVSRAPYVGGRSASDGFTR